MAMKIISADERLSARRTVKGVLVGESGAGKTWQLRTLPAATTLFLDMEAGDLSVQDWRGDALRPRTWEECQDIACLIGGPNPALRPEQAYSQRHYDYTAKQAEKAGLNLSRYETIFADSITVASRLCLQWCKGQAQAFSERTGKPDMRGAYGLLGQEMIGWLTQLQHGPANVWFVGILDRRTDDFGRQTWSLQIEGNKTGLELPGIVDQVVTLALMEGQPIPPDTVAPPPTRAFVCTSPNPWNYPAKDRSGRLAMLEEPDLGKLMAKIRGTARVATV